MHPFKRHKLTPLLAAFSLLGAGVAVAEMTRASQEAPGVSTASTADDKEKKTKKDANDKSRKDKDKKEKTGPDSKGGQTTGAGPVAGGSVECLIEKAPSGLTGVAEASGVAASRRTPGVLWSHGDSYVGEPYLYAFDARGATKGKVRLEGVKVADWEAIAVGPCGDSSCVYVGDIGDNQGARKSITVHRLPEPQPAEASAVAKDVFHATFPDGAHDAEAMFVSASGEIFVVTKGETGPIAIYRFGSSPKAGGTTVLQKVAVLQTGTAARNQWVTGASASPDGKWIALRTHGTVYFYDAQRLLQGDVKSPLKFDAASLKEPQGEGIALGADGTVFLVGESGRKGVPGTLSSGVCKLPAAGGHATP